jgi:hypothetical protein
MQSPYNVNTISCFLQQLKNHESCLSQLDSLASASSSLRQFLVDSHPSIPSSLHASLSAACTARAEIAQNAAVIFFFDAFLVASMKELISARRYPHFVAALCGLIGIESKSM